MFPSANQIRAARGLLNWTVAHLAQKVGVGTTTVSAIETGRSSGSVEVLSAIVYTLQAAGVELTEDGGVRPRQSKISLYRGHDGFCAFFDDVYDVAREGATDFCVSNCQEALFEKWLGSYDPVHLSRMARLKHFRMRVLLSEGDMDTSSSAYADYRWVRPEEFMDFSLYIYGNKSAFVDFSENDVSVTIVDNFSVTFSMRKIFDLAWRHAASKPLGAMA